MRGFLCKEKKVAFFFLYKEKCGFSVVISATVEAFLRFAGQMALVRIFVTAHLSAGGSSRCTTGGIGMVGFIG